MRIVNFNNGLLFALLGTGVLLATAFPAFAGFPMDPDPDSMRVKGFSEDFIRSVYVRNEHMQGRVPVRLRSRKQQAWYNIFTNNYIDALDEFGEDKVDPPVYEPKRDRLRRKQEEQIRQTPELFP